MIRLRPMALGLALTYAMLLVPGVDCKPSPEKPLIHAASFNVSVPVVLTVPPVYQQSTCGVPFGRVLLTIDDYPYGNDALVASVARDAYATWHVGMMGFPLRQNADAYRRRTGIDLVANARASHMWIGNHTYDHQQLTKLTTPLVSWEISHGVPSTIMRPPYGATDLKVGAVAKSLGYRECTWNVDTLDYDRFRGPDGRLHYRSVTGIRHQVLSSLAVKKLTPGSRIVILGHYFSNYPQALPLIIRDLRVRGYTMCAPSKAKTTTAVPLRLPC